MRNVAEASSPCIEDLLACSHRGKRVDTTESQGKVLNLTEITYLKRQTGKDLAHAFCILLTVNKLLETLAKAVSQRQSYGEQTSEDG